MFKTKDHWTALLFLAMLTLTSLALLWGLLPTGTKPPRMDPIPVAQVVKRLPTAHRALPPKPYGRPVREAEPVPLLPKITGLIASAEGSLNKSLDASHVFIGAYGATQRAVGRQVVVDVAEPKYTVTKLKSGSLAFTSGGKDWNTAQNVYHLKQFQDVLDQRDIELCYIQAPQKIKGDGREQLPAGSSDSGNQCADELLAAADRAEIDTLDLRTVLEESPKPWEDWFFKTDHHWTPEAAFFSYQTLCDKLETYTYDDFSPSGGVKTLNYEIPDRYRDPDQFTKTTLEDYFLGSQGKRTGPLYAGTDDIDLWVPKFPTRFRYQSALSQLDRVGRFQDTLLFADQVKQRDLYNGNPYTAYSGGDFPVGIIDNYYNPDGPRVMLLRDSFACAMTPFLALPCSALFTVDLRYFHEDLLSYVDWLQPDIVFIMYAPGSARLDSMFDFFATPAQHPQRPWGKTMDFDPKAYREKALSNRKNELFVNTLAK